jgi:hypothetical protein
MAGSGKKRTTMAKLTRESRLRERQQDKRAKKNARKLAPVHDPNLPGDGLNGLNAMATTDESDPTASAPDALEAHLGS